MVRRREFLLASLGLAALSPSARSQTERRMRRIGYLSQANAQVNAARLVAFRAGMLELRWVEGRDYAIDARYANGETQALPGLASALVATRPDLLLVPSDEDVRLLANSTKTIPIVFAITQDPVGVIRRAYAHWGMDFTPQSQTNMQDWLAAPGNAASRYGRYDYAMEPFGLSRDMIETAFEGYSRRFKLGRFA